MHRTYLQHHWLVSVRPREGPARSLRRREARDTRETFLFLFFSRCDEYTMLLYHVITRPSGRASPCTRAATTSSPARRACPPRATRARRASRALSTGMRPFRRPFDNIGSSPPASAGCTLTSTSCALTITSRFTRAATLYELSPALGVFGARAASFPPPRSSPPRESSALPPLPPRPPPSLSRWRSRWPPWWGGG